mgnify:CR=1 FL=1
MFEKADTSLSKILCLQDIRLTEHFNHVDFCVIAVDIRC